MGYTTRFDGQFNLDRPLTVPQYNQLKTFADTDHRNEAGVPGYHCDWIPTEDGMGIEHNGRENFYDYVEWLRYLINRFLMPWGITVSGEVVWQGEEISDRGTIAVTDSIVTEQEYIRDPAIPMCGECGFSYDIRKPHSHR